MRMKKISLEELEILCNDYDSNHGEYPESIYEGDAVFQFIKEVLNSKKKDKK